jgi:hypothetical protein
MGPAAGKAQTIRVRAGDTAGCLASDLAFGRLICSSPEVVGRNLKALSLRCIAAFACSHCFPAKARRLGAKLISI